MMMFVPLDVFFGECLVLMLGIRFLGLWALAVVPLHAVPVLLTQRDPFWPRTLWVNFNYYVSVGNRYLRDSGVTFTAKQLRTKAKPDDYPE